MWSATSSHTSRTRRVCPSAKTRSTLDETGQSSGSDLFALPASLRTPDSILLPTQPATEGTRPRILCLLFSREKTTMATIGLDKLYYATIAENLITGPRLTASRYS